MAIIKNSAEGGTNATAATAANTGGTSGTAFSTVSIAGATAINFSNEQAATGSLSYKMITNAQDIQYLEWLPAVSASAVFRGYIYMASLPTAGNGFIRLLTSGGGTTLAHILITNGNVQVQNSAGTTVATTSAAVPTGQWVRFEGSITNGNTATGTLNMDWYLGNGTSPISGLTVALTAQNFGTTNLGRIRFGRTAAFGTWASHYLDALAYQEGTTTYIGPDVNVPPTVDAGAVQNVAASATVNLSASASDSDGSISTYAWTWDFHPTNSVGSSTGITGASTATPSFTAGTAGNLYILRCTVTDNNGATAFDTVEVRVPVAGATTMRHLAVNGTGTGSWSKVGGSTTDGAALSDESDSTYLESPSISVSPTTLRVRLQPTSAKDTASLKERLWTNTGTSNLTIALYEGTTLREDWEQAVNSTPTEYTFNVDPSTISAISDWGNLYVEVSAVI